MQLAQTVSMAFKAISGNKVHAFLTMLGVIIGVMSVIVLIAIGQGTTASVTESIASMGTNLLTGSIQTRRVGMGMPGSLHYLLKSSIRLAVSNVLTDGSSLQPGLLKHHTKVSSQAVTGQLLYRMSADQDLSLIHIVETHQQVDHSRLTASGRSYNGNSLSRLYINRNISKKRNLFSVGERNILHIHSSVCFFQLHSTRRIRLLYRSINKVKQSLGTGKGILQLRHNA